MGQLGFFDADRRLAALSEKGDPLEAITALVPWESFRAEIEAVVLTPDEAKKSKAGRKPFDAIMMFRMLVLQSLYNLSDVQIEYQVWDRATFTRFVGLGSEDCIPDGTTLWLFREKLARAGLIETLFDRFDQHLTAKGYIARGGQMVDASIVPMPKQRNTREENEAVKRGETPAEWERKPAKNRQKDKDARWTKKHGRSFFGYKNHVNVDRTHKLIRRYAVTDAAVHDSRKLNGLLHQGNTSHDVFGDSAYRSAANEATLKGRAPVWMFETEKPVVVLHDPNQVFWSYNEGKVLRDSSLKELTDYYVRLVSWYTKGGFTDELGKFHKSGHQL